jgi:predicted flap endonuclease-1-like 5' DNA nuclease
MANKKTKKVKKLQQAKAIVKKINNDLIDASFNTIESTVKTGQKWQKLTSKLIKKAEPLSKQQINMVVDTAETIKGQLEHSTERLKNLVGYDPKMIDKAKKMFTESPLAKKAEKKADKLKKEISKNPFVKKAEKMANKLKKELNETIEDVKDKVEDITEDVKEKVEKVSKPVTKKAPVKKTAPKKETVKKVDKKVAVKNDLKVIKGVGPKMEALLNENGISSYEDLDKITLMNLEEALTNAGMNTKMYNSAEWKVQAKELAKN